MKTNKKYTILAAPITALGLILIWQLAVVTFNVSPYILPSPTKIISTTFEKAPLLGAHALTTFGEALGGLLIALGLGAGLKRFPADLNLWDSQRVRDERVFAH
jgi:NitT/TauT family transport system permease protein